MIHKSILKTAISIMTVAAFSGAIRYEANAQTLPSNYTSAMRYDLSGRVVAMIMPDPDGGGSVKYAAIRNTYDTKGLLVKMETGELASWQSEAIAPANWTGFTIFQTLTYNYDIYGNKTKEQLAVGSTIQALTHYSYNSLGYLTCEAQRMNSAVFATVTSNACIQGSAGTDGPDRITRYTRDTLGRVLKIEKGVGTTFQQDYATYTLNGAGLPLTIKDANGNLASREYDGFGRITKWTFPSKTSVGQVNTADYEAYTYDANGNQLTRRKRDGQVIAFQYDKLNRAIKKDVTGTASDVYYGYDLRGLQLYARFGSTSGQGVTSAYDGFGRLTSSTTNMGGTARTLSYQYDANGNRTRLTFPDGVAFAYAYDGLDRLTTVNENTSTAVVTLGYNNKGQRTTLGRPGGAPTTYGFDSLARLTSLTHDLASTTYDVTYGFAYTPSSQIKSKSLSNNQYLYAPANGTTSYSVNGLNQYTSISGSTISHDANGNLTSDGVTSYSYDVENRLVSASGPASLTLKYDPNGRLYETSGGGVVTRFLYDGDELIAEYNSSGTVLRRYVHGASVDEPLLWYEGSTVSSTTRRHLHADHQGSVVAVSSSSGSRLGTNRYGVYGEPVSTNLGRFAYTGQIQLPGLSLYHYKARVYSPQLGRFLQTDPIGYEDDVNLYGYVGNDPLGYIDPTGEGKVKYLIKAYRGAKSYFTGTRKQAVRARQKGRDVRVEGPGSSKQAKNIDRMINGQKSVRHDGHKLDNGDVGRPHYQHKNGGNGHTFYSGITALTISSYVDDDSSPVLKFAAEAADLFNPFSDISEILKFSDEEFDTTFAGQPSDVSRENTTSYGVNVPRGDPRLSHGAFICLNESLCSTFRDYKIAK